MMAPSEGHIANFLASPRDGNDGRPNDGITARECSDRLLLDFTINTAGRRLASNADEDKLLGAEAHNRRLAHNGGGAQPPAPPWPPAQSTLSVVVVTTDVNGMKAIQKTVNDDIAYGAAAGGMPPGLAAAVA